MNIIEIDIDEMEFLIDSTNGVLSFWKYVGKNEMA